MVQVDWHLGSVRSATRSQLRILKRRLPNGVVDRVGSACEVIGRIEEVDVVGWRIAVALIGNVIRDQSLGLGGGERVERLGEGGVGIGDTNEGGEHDCGW